jgi:hypothetical protein
LTIGGLTSRRCRSPRGAPDRVTSVGSRPRIVVANAPALRIVALDAMKTGSLP